MRLSCLLVGATAAAGGLALEQSPRILFAGAPSSSPAGGNILSGDCGIGWVSCGLGCMPIGGDCCGGSNYCEIGDYCDTEGCCPIGKFCSGTPTACGSGKELCGDGCIPEGKVCCPNANGGEGGWCDEGETCLSNNRCGNGGSGGGGGGGGATITSQLNTLTMPATTSDPFSTSSDAFPTDFPSTSSTSDIASSSSSAGSGGDGNSGGFGSSTTSAGDDGPTQTSATGAGGQTDPPTPNAAGAVIPSSWLGERAILGAVVGLMVATGPFLF